MYKSKFGVTIINPGRFDNLSISWDYDDDLEDKKAGRYAVLLHIPDKKKFDHSHIQLSRKKARKLRDWLNEFLKDV